MESGDLTKDKERLGAVAFHKVGRHHLALHPTESRLPEPQPHAEIALLLLLTTHKRACLHMCGTRLIVSSSGCGVVT
jgi:hypothetical protein